MGILGISDSRALYSVIKLYSSKTKTSTSSESVNITSLTGDRQTQDPADSVSLSPQGRIYSSLQQLQQTNQDDFKKVCYGIAKRLSSSGAQNAGSGNLSLAAKFISAAESGEMISLNSSPTMQSAKSANLNSFYSNYALNQYAEQVTAGKTNSNSSISHLLHALLTPKGASS